MCLLKICYYVPEYAASGVTIDSRVYSYAVASEMAKKAKPQP